ncbi:MAG TPA: glycosyltransferase, partial [Anaerolineae bacterium]|nr:glycosyltransferase [Anaerolineae bacterium]
MAYRTERPKLKRTFLQGPDLTFDGKNPPREYPPVSLCMIVKNEEENLANCIGSVGDFPAEIIVVDTGSTDRTVQIAESLGAKVYHFRWINDFAAARNESIRHATGEWIFWMDADDRLEPDGAAKLKQAGVSGKADVYMCRGGSHGKGAGSADAVVEHFRLFRNGLGLKFHGALHESIAPDVIDLGLVVARTNVEVRHTGYSIEIDDYKAKARRNMAIINAELQKNPDDLYWRYHRAASLSILGDTEQAAADYEAVLADPPPQLNWDIYVYQAHTGLLDIYNNAGKFDDARRILNLALERFPQRRHLAVVAGLFYFGQDELDTALEYLLRAQRLPRESDMLGQAWSPGKLESVLGQVYLLRGEYALARQAFMDMLAENGNTPSRTPPAEYAAAERLFAAGDFDGVCRVLDAVAMGNLPALRLLARAENKRERWHSATANLAQAMALDEPRPDDWVTLAEYVLHTRHFDSAERLCQLALQANPENAQAMNLVGFIAFQQNDAEKA